LQRKYGNDKRIILDAVAQEMGLAVEASKTGAQIHQMILDAVAKGEAAPQETSKELEKAQEETPPAAPAQEPAKEPEVLDSEPKTAVNKEEVRALMIKKAGQIGKEKVFALMAKFNGAVKLSDVPDDKLTDFFNQLLQAA
jgi:hypothetical protein